MLTEKSMQDIYLELTNFFGRGIVERIIQLIKNVRPVPLNLNKSPTPEETIIPESEIRLLYALLNSENATQLNDSGSIKIRKAPLKKPKVYRHSYSTVPTLPRNRSLLQIVNSGGDATVDLSASKPRIDSGEPQLSVENSRKWKTKDKNDVTVPGKIEISSPANKTKSILRRPTFTEINITVSPKNVFNRSSLGRSPIDKEASDRFDEIRVKDGSARASPILQANMSVNNNISPKSYSMEAENILNENKNEIKDFINENRYELMSSEDKSNKNNLEELSIASETEEKKGRSNEKESKNRVIDGLLINKRNSKEEFPDRMESELFKKESVKEIEMENKIIPKEINVLLKKQSCNSLTNKENYARENNIIIDDSDSSGLTPLSRHIFTPSNVLPGMTVFDNESMYPSDLYSNFSDRKNSTNSGYQKDGIHKNGIYKNFKKKSSWITDDVEDV